MRLLLDECVPRKVKLLLAVEGHECQTAGEAGLAGKENGELLREAEKRFDVLITIDKNIPHQQNLSGRNLAILIIRPVSNDIDDIRPQIASALVALRSLKPGEIIQVGTGS